MPASRRTTRYVPVARAGACWRVREPAEPTLTPGVAAATAMHVVVPSGCRRLHSHFKFDNGGARVHGLCWRQVGVPHTRLARDAVSHHPHELPHCVCLGSRCYVATLSSTGRLQIVPLSEDQNPDRCASVVQSSVWCAYLVVGCGLPPSHHRTVGTLRHRDAEYRRVIASGAEVRKWGVMRVYEAGCEYPVRCASHVDQW